MSIVNYLLKRIQLYIITKNQNTSPCFPAQSSFLDRGSESHPQLANTLGLEFLAQPHYIISLSHL